MADPSASLVSRPDARRLLSRILDQPDLIEAVRRLPASALSRLVDHVGLEDAGELVALATSAQLGLLLDEDVWRSARPGEDEAFDAARFALWLEVLVEAGDRVAAQKLADLPEELVSLALSRQVLVVNLDELAVQMANMGKRGDALDKALEGALHVEFDQYRVMARRHDGWDALVSLLLALDRDHRALFERLMERAVAATDESVEEHGGLLQLLTHAEMLESDAAAEREDRRAREGWVAPSQAAAFLALARTTDLAAIRARTDRDPITRAYFREYAPTAAATSAPSTDRSNGPSTDQRDAATSAAADSRLAELLREAEVVVEARPERMLPVALTPSDAQGRFTRALRRLGDHDPEAHARRLDELGFVANVLLAGASLAGRRLRPLEAAEAGMALCNLGLDHELREQTAGVAGAAGAGATLDEQAAGILAHSGSEKLLRIAVQLLHRDLALPAARALGALLARLTVTGADYRIVRARRALDTALGGHKPFSARHRLVELAAPPTVPGVPPLGSIIPLLDELPRLGVPADAPDGGRIITTMGELAEARHLLGALA